ncbi:MAG: phenylalanine--tRNA ligase subunit alpha [Spirochaetales bacterium]|nr:phenylalanine--tRNA ligase subunit alpha [Spirochaetales bacterium]
MDVDVKNLHPLEVRVLKYLQPGMSVSSDDLVKALGMNVGQCNQALSWLVAKQLTVEDRRDNHIFFELTETGAGYAEIGTPAERMYHLVRSETGLTLPEIASRLDLENSDTGSAFGMLSKLGYLQMGPDKTIEAKRSDVPDVITVTKGLLEKARKKGLLDQDDLDAEEVENITRVSRKRGAGNSAFRMVEREAVYYVLSPSGAKAREEVLALNLTGDEIGALTPEQLATGAWKDKQFRSYNIHVPPKRVLPGRKNPYCQYLETVKDKLVSLGFEEFDGPLVETEFWNADALFMPQFHSARDIHDVYYLAEPTHAKEIEQPWLDRVASAHENGAESGSKGWGYAFDRDFTRRLVLRSQGTVLSAKQLPKAKVPGKYFGIVRCFRYDQVDATHGADFYQTEGIVLSEEVNLRTLLGLLELFAVEVAGATDFKFAPAYFPFTEPSIEVHIKHPVLGWFELGGSGIFRPEVTKPLGVDVPVLAWGLGIDRMAMMQLEIDDMRELFSKDLEKVRLRKRS